MDWLIYAIIGGIVGAIGGNYVYQYYKKKQK